MLELGPRALQAERSMLRVTRLLHGSERCTAVNQPDELRKTVYGKP
ncbi:hypothetical protein [Mycobacterium conspicuum]|nr:hypothetical protein [Mycobacterium conspicuum]